MAEENLRPWYEEETEPEPQYNQPLFALPFSIQGNAQGSSDPYGSNVGGQFNVIIPLPSGNITGGVSGGVSNYGGTVGGNLSGANIQYNTDDYSLGGQYFDNGEYAGHGVIGRGTIRYADGGQVRPWSDVAKSYRENFGPDLNREAVNYLLGQYQAYKDPIGTASSIGSHLYDLGTGLVSKGVDALGYPTTGDIKYHREKPLDDTLQSLKDNFGSVRGFQDYVSEHPVQATGTVLGALTGAGGLARKAITSPELGRLLTDESGALRLWHGSPHDFDRFDLSKIGTGEGAQAYGYGLYFAENPNVAKDYKNKLSGDGTELYLNDMPFNDLPEPIQKAVLSYDTGRDPQQHITLLEKRTKSDPDAWGQELDAYKNLINKISKGLAKVERKPLGHLYEVNVNAEPEQLLDWDIPLSNQSDYLKDTLLAQDIGKNWTHSSLRGNDIYKRFVNQGDNFKDFGVTSKARKANESDASKILSDLGVPGIKYLDAGSRSQGQGSHNYVIFDDKLIDILNKYADGGAVSEDELGNLYDASGKILPKPQATSPQFTRGLIPEEDLAPSQSRTENFLRLFSPVRMANAFLPVGHDEQHNISPAVPSVIADPAQSWVNMVDRHRSGIDDPEADVRDSFTVGSSAGLGGLAATPMKPVGSLGIFGGRLAKTANQEALKAAEEMASKGAARETIWPETGWFQGKDTNWRFEIPDDKARIKNTESPLLGDILDHPELYEAYPELKNINVQSNLDTSSRGSYLPKLFGGPKINFLSFLGPDQKKSTLLHEIQHAIQDIEDFQLGGNLRSSTDDIVEARFKKQKYKQQINEFENKASDEARHYISKANDGDPEAKGFVNNAIQKWEKQLGKRSEENPFGVDEHQAVQFELLENDKIFNNIIKDYNRVYNLENMSPEDYYTNLAGEVEPRTVQKRIYHSPIQKKEVPPWKDYDVPEEKQILAPARGASYSQELPMDPASRLARAKEMGFDTDTPLYHGTHADFPEFSLKPSPDRDIFGIHLGTKEQAEDIVRNHHHVARNKLGEWSENGKILPVYIKGKNLLELPDLGNENAWDMGQLRYEMAERNIPFKGDKFNPTYEDIRRSLQDAGYDGIKYVNNFEGVNAHGPQPSIMLFDPKNIRSVNAAFDTSKSSSSNLLAANPKTTALLPSLEDKDKKKKFTPLRGGFGPKYDENGNPKDLPRLRPQN